ncbi:Nicotinamidase-related amidase [Mucilaginibacter mallensis]|uniref:Nicotinamidase-related amidase n=1 Tax=Mucilaginibacter mallensis TaxID=652787 RepID=A0A1H1T7M4_MUCMA|nr:isochorismatase family cysteine hydrolase [Mucilaginibacter mallensis]SDS56161.1 Nicotinamidase-related amidase [Mucilaginibacter mallensis]
MEQTQNTALLVIDLQVGILAMLPDSGALIPNTAKAIASAREKKIPVIYVTVGFRPGAPEVSLNNKSFGAGKERFASMDMAEFTKVLPELEPMEGEVTMIKRRVSAFTGNDLEVVLRAQGIQHMVLTGVATSGAILSTVREAADKDYRITVLADCCADGDEEVHRVLTTKVFPRQADVLTVEEWSKL